VSETLSSPHHGTIMATAFNPKGIFEVHLSVEDRRRSTEFYQRVLGFELATHIDGRDITFLWMGGRGSGMLGLWGPECPDPPISRGIGHFAMRLSKEEVIEAVDKLRQLGVTPLDFDGKPTQQPVVLAWMPAVSIYFQDPDGHSLEFISMLDEKPEADLDVLNWQDWEQRR